jgi:hypothetical protein
LLSISVLELIEILILIQKQLIFNMIVSTDTVRPASIVSYQDLATALTQLLLACEMPIFIVLLYFAFLTTPCKDATKAQGTNFFIALGQTLNINNLGPYFCPRPYEAI